MASVTTRLVTVSVPGLAKRIPRRRARPSGQRPAGRTANPGREHAQTTGVRPVSGDVLQIDVPTELVDELGRILGEALFQQYQRDTAIMDNPPSGLDHVDGEEGGHCG